MKTVLIDQDDDIASSPSFMDQARTAAVSIGRFLMGSSTAVTPTPYSSGYDSFCQGVPLNPHPENTNAHVEWARGRCDFEEDFDDRVA